MGEWDAMSYEGKDTILRVVSYEADRMFQMAEPPQAWEAPTACRGWQTRDVIGHLVDTTEGYFEAFDAARAQQRREAYGVAGPAGASATAVAHTDGGKADPIQPAADAAVPAVNGFTYSDQVPVGDGAAPAFAATGNPVHND